MLVCRAGRGHPIRHSSMSEATSAVQPVWCGAESGAVVAVEVFVEQEKVAPVGVVLELPGVPPWCGRSAGRVPGEDADQAVGERRAISER